MPVKSAQVSVTTTAADISQAMGDVSEQLSALIRNRGSVAVYLGGSDVSSANGLQLDPGESVSIDLNAGGGSIPIAASGAKFGLFAVAASGTQTVHVIQAGG